MAHDHGHDAQQLERLTFFSDAVFAIAITLLVIEVRVPHIHEMREAVLGQALLDLIPNYVGFLISFLVIGRFWIAHHRVFGLLARTDDRLVWTNLLFLLTVAFMPFPTAVISEYVQLRTGIGFYAGWLVVIGVMHRVLLVAALGGDRHLVHADVDPGLCRQYLRAAWIPVLIGASGLVLGMVAPVFGLAALMLGSPVIGWALRRRAGRLAAAG